MADDMDKNKQQSGQYGQGQQNQQSGQQDQGQHGQKGGQPGQTGQQQKGNVDPSKKILLRTSRMSGTGSAAPRSLQCKR